MGTEMADSSRRAPTLTRGIVYESTHACAYCGAQRYLFLGVRRVPTGPVPEAGSLYLFACAHCHSTRIMTAGGGPA